MNKPFPARPVASAPRGTVSNAAHPECATCADPAQKHGPPHVPSRHCQSGGRPHCSCGVCF